MGDRIPRSLLTDTEGYINWKGNVWNAQTTSHGDTCFRFINFHKPTIH